MIHVKRHAIIFCRPFDADTMAVDLATGRHGFGHVATWHGHTSGGDPVVIDSSFGRGVGFRPLPEVTRGFGCRAVWLDDPVGEYVLAKALAHVGKPYDYRGLVRHGRDAQAHTCSGLVYHCLPPFMQRRCRFRGPVSPNDLARAFEVPSC